MAVAETYLPASVCLDPAGSIEAKLRVLILDKFDFEHLFQFTEFVFELSDTAVVERCWQTRLGWCLSVIRHCKLC